MLHLVYFNSKVEYMFILVFFISCLQTAQSIGNCECGIGAKAKITSRIKYGKIVTPEGKYPWMVWLRGCGGTFITNQHVLSAAHCVMVRMKGMKVYFGSDDKG